MRLLLAASIALLPQVTLADGSSLSSGELVPTGPLTCCAVMSPSTNSVEDPALTPTALTSSFGCDRKGAQHIVIEAPKNGDPIMWAYGPIDRMDFCLPPGTTITQGTPIQ